MEKPVHYFLQNLYILEGMDMTGKSTFVKENLPDSVLYECHHDLTDQTVGRDNSWTIGYGIVDFLGQVKDEIHSQIVINRGVFSSYVYQRLYNNSYIDQRILDFYKNNRFFKEEIGHIYVKHHDSETAKEIFEKSKARPENPNEISRKYDKFNSFNDYWIFYNTADQLFKEVYDYVGVRPRVFETLPNMSWNEVSFWR